MSDPCFGRLVRPYLAPESPRDAEWERSCGELFGAGVECALGALTAIVFSPEIRHEE
jgi:hypothetical protein